MVLIEICIDSRAGLDAALLGGAQRLEVCSRLDLGGLTPDAQLLDLSIQRATARAVRVQAMVRPRANETFVPDAAEYAELLRDLERVKAQGAHGAVFGVLDAAGRVDRARTAELVREARPMAVTFHRAFDRVRDQIAELGVLIELGVERVLTSGGAANALEGVERLRTLVEQSRGRITILAGAGVRAHNAARILAGSGASELHGSVPFQLP